MALTESITILWNQDLCAGLRGGDSPREGREKDVAGVTIVACVDVVTDVECDMEEGVEERGGVEDSGCAVVVASDAGCGFLLIKGSLRLGGIMAGGPAEGDPAATSGDVWDTDIDLRGSLRGSEEPVPSLRCGLLATAN